MNSYRVSFRCNGIRHRSDDFVYDRHLPGLTEELRTKNPVTTSGRRGHKHHQWFNTDKGRPKLKEHIAGVIALLRAAENWEGFKKGVIPRSADNDP